MEYSIQNLYVNPLVFAVLPGSLACYSGQVQRDSAILRWEFTSITSVEP